MPEITATKTAADMTCAKPHTLMPDGGQNRRAARAQAAALRWLVRIAAFLTAAVLVFLIGYILVMGIPNLKPELFAWEYNSENVSLTPALINTVLMTAFALLNPHADGTFTLDGADSSSFSLQQWRRNVAYLPQKPMLMGDSVADTIRLPWTLAVRRADEASAPDDHAATGKKTSARRGRFSRLFRSEQSQAKLALPDQLIRNTLDAMGCEDIDLARAPHDLSGGQAARVSLARTLLTRPAVLLADEVDAGLDDDNADKVASIMASAAARGMAIVRIRHRPPDGRATRIVTLSSGRLS